MKSAGQILVVDDSETSLALLLAILTAEGYEVRPADSGELALAAVTASRPEVILLDMRMPGMSGIDVCRKLKSDAQSRDIPVIFLSASLDFEARLEALQSGAVDFINKPFRRDELLARLKTHLELARLHKDLEQRVMERTEELQATNDQLKGELIARMRIEEKLRESEQRFRSMADTAPAGIWMTNPEGRITYVSQWALSFTGSAIAKDAGEGWLHRVHPADLQRVTDAVCAAISRPAPFQMEYRMQRFDGEYRWIADTGTPRFVNSEYAGHIGIIIDITELKLGQERALANQKLESLGVLTAGIAHDFNNLLSTILAHCDLALDEISCETPEHENVSTIATVALRASEIVSLLMTYAGNTDSSIPEPVELSPLIEEMVQLLQVSVSRTTTLQLNLAKDPTPIWVNPGQVRQVILNLIMNASEALEGQPGTVVISTTNVYPGSGEPAPADLGDGTYVLLQVSDTGCGMSEEIRAKIFDPFFSTKFLGRGLGLASVQGILRAAGGRISVASSPGQGSTFRIWWPCLNRRLDHDGQQAQLAPDRTCTVLLVDDEEGLRVAVEKALHREGFQIITARDGLAAVELFTKHSSEIELAVLDMTLPGLSGSEVCAEIRRLKPGIQVLFTSANSPEEQREPSSERFLQKPYRIKELVHTLREMTAPADVR